MSDMIEDLVETPEKVTAVNPAIVVAIASTVFAITDEDPKVNENEAIYLTAREYVASLDKASVGEAKIDLIFTYYLEGYRGIHAIRETMNSDDKKLSEVRKMQLYNEAALSVFDLYLSMPGERVVRRMLSLSAAALHEVVASMQANETDRPMNITIGHLSNLALIVGTIRTYVRGFKRSRNYAYISWVRDFIKKTLSTTDLSFMDDEPVLKTVIFQLTHKKTVIVLPAA